MGVGGGVAFKYLGDIEVLFAEVLLGLWLIDHVAACSFTVRVPAQFCREIGAIL
jgi:hypothetical protein